MAGSQKTMSVADHVAGLAREKADLPSYWLPPVVGISTMMLLPALAFLIFLTVFAFCHLFWMADVARALEQRTMLSPDTMMNIMRASVIAGFLIGVLGTARAAMFRIRERIS